MNSLPHPELDEEMLKQINQLEEKINPQHKINPAKKETNHSNSVNSTNNLQKPERSKSYAKNILFGLAYLYIHLQQAARAEQYLRTLCLLDRKHKAARVLLAVSLVMQGKKISAELFNQIRQNSSPSLLLMLAKRIQR
jgi:thioredoxin-like negative regulator of GroEL